VTPVDVLRGSRESYAVKLRDFLRISSKRPDAYIIFFEGQDAKYYSHRIELLRQELPWEGINSGGKDNVLKLYELITNHDQHKLVKTLFFIDRDFDEPDELPNDTRVYITPGYAVENLYVTEQVIRRILRDEFGLAEHSETDKSFEKCVAAFKQSLSTFIDSAALLNGWVLLQRRHEKANPGTSKANLSSISLPRTFQVGLLTCSSLYTLADIERATNTTKSFTTDEVMAAVAAIPPNERPARFRGKFQAYFLRVFLSKLCEDANVGAPELFSEKRSVALNVSDRNLVSELCQYADTPACLRGFINAIPAVSAPVSVAPYQAGNTTAADVGLLDGL
jgi:hypothetical protein